MKNREGIEIEVGQTWHGPSGHEYRVVGFDGSEIIVRYMENGEVSYRPTIPDSGIFTKLVTDPKRKDQITLLQGARKFTDTGRGKWCCVYQEARTDLIKMGLVNDNGTITLSGRAALWLLGIAANPIKEETE